MKLGLAISLIEKTQTLFVTCYTHRLDRVEQLVHMIDQPGQTRFFKIRQLHHTSAEGLAPQICTLSNQLQDIPVVLSGMPASRLNQAKAVKQIPILGRLPLMGFRFRGVSNKDIQNKLYIFVRAKIIRPEETLQAGQNALKRISEQSRNAFEQHEKEFQDYRTLPGTHIERVTPEKVLDMQQRYDFTVSDPWI
ncbi:MAG: hypothetical protein GY809_19630 [Planctomycetes bacterium]|nr:hypothetical protein [Planctomycetota bacterium]